MTPYALASKKHRLPVGKTHNFVQGMDAHTKKGRYLFDHRD
jgi:hypothetical protein